MLNYFNCHNKLNFNPQEYNILIVEDSKSLLKIIEIKFKTMGFKTFTALNLKEAKEQLSTNEINYLILDINLPDGNGYDLIKELEGSNIKIIVFTSQVDSQLKESSYQKGVIDFLNKDKHFLYKVSEIPNLIKQIEKNKFKTILIVDDSHIVREQLRDILINRNYNVLEAVDAKEAMEKIKLEKIDLMLLDLQLGSTSGYEFLIRNKELIFEKYRIRVLFITGNISSSLLRDAFRMGVKEVIKKPYLIEELILKTDSFINEKDIEDDMLCSKQLLEQYKDTVDRSSIVSKADARGKITYVNEPFCEISGYSEEELLGKSHSIVRHPDMNPDVFRELWYTIKDLKQPWSGLIKNKAKDGSPYWVKTIINPIIDQEGNILEYIGIRTDISDIERTKIRLKKQYDISKNNFDEIVNLSKLYENAMEQSSLILRIDTNKIITYVNENFYEISKFTKEELIGKNYDELSTIDSDMEEMWDTVKNKEIWKGQINNIFKDGLTCYFFATVVPIINLNGEILEYMIIKKDITDVVTLHKEIEDTQREIIYRIGEIGESRSQETGNHVKRVATYSKLLAQLYGLDEKQCNILFTASPMHDIGKVGIPDSILNKPGKLSEEEWEIMKKHCVIGYDILKSSQREILQAGAIVALEHHEKWDGSGYPRGLKGKDIHIFGRITAIADVFDALGSDRCYKKAWEDEKIFSLFKEERGKHFDPELIDIFFKNIDKFLEIRDKYKD